MLLEVPATGARSAGGRYPTAGRSKPGGGARSAVVTCSACAGFMGSFGGVVVLGCLAAGLARVLGLDIGEYL